MKQLRHTIISVISYLLPAVVNAQAIDNTLSYKNINSDSYFRLNYENDFFSATDIYYTQGFTFELVQPWVKKFPISKLLVHPAFGYTRYGIDIEHNGYTPTTISSDALLNNDRPFTACFFLKTFLIATDSENRQRFSSSLSTGVIGPDAGGKEMQTDIHRWLHNITPHGWQYQIHNDAILNYQVDYEKQLLSYGHFFSLDADAIARAGTLSDKANVGSTLMFGYFDSPFKTTTATKNNFRIYAYEHPAVNIIGYDATLEGGLFDHSSPYTISPKDVTRLVFENRFGFVVIYQRFYLEYFQSLLSNEFNAGNYHTWGGVQIAFGL